MQAFSDIEITLIDALEHTSEAFVVYDKDRKIILCNSHFRQLYGYTKEQTRPGTYVHDLVALDIKKGNVPQDVTPTCVEEYLSSRLKMSSSTTGAFEYPLNDGRWISINERELSSGGLVSVQRDVTERKKIEKELQRSNHLFSAAFDADSNAKSISVLETGTFLDVNKAWCDLRGLTREKAVGRTALELNVWGSAEKRAEVLRQVNAQKEGGHSEISLFDSNGNTRYVILNWKVIQIDDQECLFLSSNDVTAIRAAEVARKQSEYSFRKIFESVPIGLALFDKKTEVLSVSNQEYLDIIGVDAKPGDLIDWRSITHPDDLERDEFHFDRLQSGEIDNYQMEKRYLHADGTVRRAVLTTVTIDNVDSSTGGKHLLMLADVTDKKETELALAISRDRFSDFITAGTDWYWETDQDLQYTYLSPEVVRRLERSNDDYIGNGYLEFLNKERELQEADQVILDRFYAREDFRDCVVYRTQKKTGKKVWLRISGKPYFGVSGEFQGYRGSSCDITEQVDLEERLQQSQKMEVVGQLAGGIAHDFNNLLAVIQGNAELLKEALETGDAADLKKVGAVIKAAQRGAELTHSMLAFSRKQSLNPVKLRLDHQIEGIMDMICRSLGETIQVPTAFDDDLWFCEADAGKVENVILNLCLNARDAMPGGGKLTIKVSNKILTDEDLQGVDDIEPGKFVALSVTDTGVGIPPDAIDRVFEPFFTTKGVGEGTGLGLSMVYGFAQQSKGHITLTSELDKGTTVTLYLPCAYKASE